MDASTTAAAALAIVVDASQQAAMEALLRERERLAMIVEDQASYMAQRHWVGSLQIQRLGQPMTWQTAYRQRHNDLAEAHGAMRAAADALRAGDAETALSRLDAEVGDPEQSEDEELSEAGAMEEEEEEEEDMEEDDEVSPA